MHWLLLCATATVVAHACFLKQTLFLVLLWIKKNKKKHNFIFVSKTLSFRKCFLNENIFVSKKKNFVSETLNFVWNWKSSLFKQKSNFTFDSKTLSFRKCFQNKNIFDLKKNYFRLGNTFTFVFETLGKKTEKNRNSFVVVAHACHPPLRASVSTWESFQLFKQLGYRPAYSSTD